MPRRRPSDDNPFQEILDLQAELQRKLKNDGEKLLKKHFQSYFKRFPDVEAVRWRQYTPYFNDGDPCTFSVHDFSYLKPGETAGYDGDQDGFRSGWDPKELPEYMRSDLPEIPDEVLLAVFGDHVQVTATPGGFEVEEYSHD